jgi:hypothetical protein
MRPVRNRSKTFEELEDFIVSALDDAVARLVADIPPAVAAITAGTTPPVEQTTAVAAINTAADQLEAALKPPAPVPPTPGTTPVTPPAAAAAADSGALTPPA